MKDESNQYTHNIEALNAEMKRLDNLLGIAEKKKDALDKSMVKKQRNQNTWDVIMGSMFLLFFIVIIYRAVVMN